MPIILRLIYPLNGAFRKKGGKKLSENKTINFNNSDNFIFDDSVVEFKNDGVQLKEITVPSPQIYSDDFLSTVNKLYDGNKIDISSGTAKLKLIPTNSVNNISYDTNAGKTYDTNDIEIIGGQTCLKKYQLQSSFNQNFSSSTGFTFDPSKTEFVAGKIQQKDQRPSGSTFFSNYETDENANWGNGVLSGTLNGAASVSGGNLIMSGDVVAYADYNADLNADSQQIGAIRVGFIPNYNGSPSVDDLSIFHIGQGGGATNNSIELYHRRNGRMRLVIRDSADLILIDVNLSPFSFVSGQEYEIELNYDITVGQTRLFIDGTQIGATQTATGIRDSNINLLRIGSDFTGLTVNNSDISYILVFNTVQHLGNYTAPSSQPSSTIYLGDVIDLPQFTYGGLGNLITWDSSLISDTNSPRFILNGLYWNGATWATSSNDYFTANSSSDISANITTLPASQTLDVKIVTASNNIQDIVEDINILFTAESFPITNPTIDLTQDINSPLNTTVNNWLSFSDVIGFTANDSIKYTLSDDSGLTYKYWNGSAWVLSSGFSESNTNLEINSNISSFPVTTNGLRVRVFLHSDNGKTTPCISSVSIGYNDNIYPMDNPMIDYSVNNIQDFVAGIFGYTSLNETSTITNQDRIKYVLSTDNGASWLYYNTSWVQSSGSYSQSNTASEITSNFSLFPQQNNQLRIRIFLHSGDGSTTPILDQIDINYSTNLESFTTTNPTIETKTGIDQVQSLDGFQANITEPPNTSIKFIIKDGEDKKWFDGNNWVISDGTFAQSNTYQEIDFNRRTLSINNALRIVTFLNSADGVNTPRI